jgi:hypothetical protein
MIAQLKYEGGVPFYRLEDLEAGRIVDCVRPGESGNTITGFHTVGDR